MTGFGAATREEGGLTFQVEARSVNHRHLLVKSRLTSDFAALESEVEGLVKKRIERGSITVNLSYDRAAASPTLAIDLAAAKRMHGELQGLADELGLDGEVTLDTLLALPGVVRATDDDARDSAERRKAVLEAVDDALARMVEMREVEGGAIDSDLRKHADAIKKLTSKIDRRMPTVVRTHQKNLEKRVRDLLGDAHSIQSADLAREVAVLADRHDVSEEVARLASHLAQLDDLLSKGGRVGRKLDFLVQEIFREINTIGSKCSDAKVSHWVVDAKTHVERLREQVQNVE